MLRGVLVFFFFAAVWSLSAQVVTSVSFEGLKRTREVYLHQFLETMAGEPLDSAKVLRDQQQLTNLEIFSNATYKVKKNGEGYEVMFVCNELHTLLPIFSFGGIRENFWVQVGGSEVNLGGRGHKITTYYQYYDRHSAALHLTFDRIRQSNWGMNVDLVKWSTLEPLFFGAHRVEYTYDNYTAGATAIRHFNFRDKVVMGGAFFTEDYRQFTPGSFEGAPARVDKKKLLGKMIFSWNRVNYHFFYLDGWHNQLNLQTVQSLDGDPGFYIFFHDLKGFKRIGHRGNVAARMRVGLSSNQESPFAPFVLDSYLNIRGVGNRVDRGTGVVILNVECRHTVWEQQNLAVQGVVFSDMGSWRTPGGDFSDFTNRDNLVLFAGGGFRLIHKKIYNAILRVDYGFNLRTPEVNGFVIGLGQYF